MILKVIEIIRRSAFRDHKLIISGSQLQEAHNDEQIEGTYYSMLKI